MPGPIGFTRSRRPDRTGSAAPLLALARPGQSAGIRRAITLRPSVNGQTVSIDLRDADRRPQTQVIVAFELTVEFYLTLSGTW